MLKRKKQIIAKVMATTMLASTLASTFATNVSAAEPQTKATVSETTIAGDDRYKTAVEISKNYSSTSKHAVIVNGQKGIVDALTATPYASLKKAPILMTQSTKLNADTKKELTRRGVKTVDIVGGVNSVSDEVKAEIEAMGIKVNRIAGDSKYDTALEVAKKIDDISDISKIAVANGEVLADAVSVAAPAAQNEMPIILAHPTKGLDADVKKYIDGEGISTSYVIGGTSSVSTATQNSLPGTKKRLEGTDRQGTNASVIKEFYTSSSYDNMYVAKSGQVNKADEIADALAVGVLAASNQDPVMLVGKSLGSTQKTLLESKDLEKITKVGGNIPTASIDAIKNTQSSTKTVTTVAELKTALANAKDGDIINFNPSGTVSEAVSLSTTKNVTANLNGTHSGAVSVDMANGTLNINGNISNKVSVDAVKAINVKSGVTVKHLEIKSGAKNSNISNNGTVTTFDVLSGATGVKIAGSGNITELNPQGDTDFTGVTGTIGNMNSENTIASINAINSKQIQIIFSKNIDENSIIDNKGTETKEDDELVQDGEAGSKVNRVIFKSTTSIDGGQNVISDSSVCNAELNGRILTITAPDGYYFKGNYTVEVQNITSMNIAQEKQSINLSVNDTTAPSVTGVKYNVSTNKFEVTLSEPIDSSDRAKLVLKVNDNINVSSVTWNPIGNKFTFTRPVGVNLGTTAKIYIDGLQDMFDNKMQPYTKTNVSVQGADLTVTVTQPLDNSIRVKFNKKVKVADINAAIKIEDKNTPAQPSLDKGTVTEVASTIEEIAGVKYADTFDITISNMTYNSKNENYIKLIVNPIVDITGATSKKIETNTITLKKDTVDPKITSIKANSNNKGFEVTISEDITGTKLSLGSYIFDTSKVKLFKGSGVSVSVGSVALKPGTTNVINVIAHESALVDGKLPDGTYQVKFNECAMKDLNGVLNKEMETSKVTIKNEDTTEYKITDISSEDINEFVVSYTGELDDEKLSYNNFKLNNQVIKSTSPIVVNHGAKTITVDLTASDSVTSSGNATFTATGLTLKNGKVLKDYTDSFVVKDNTAPTLESAEIRTKSHQLVLNFDENIATSKNLTTESTDNLTTILEALEIKVGDNYIYTGKESSGDSMVDKAKLEVNGREVIITIKPVSNAEDAESEWTKNVEKSKSTIKINLKANQSLIKDGNDNTARVLREAKKITINNKL